MRTVSLVIALACAACQGSATSPAPGQTAEIPKPSAPPPVPPPSEPAPPTPAPPTPKRLVPKPLPAATHGRSIQAIAISDDGTAAVTLDGGDGVRLWPTLDGTREPVAVPLVAPQEVILGRDGGMFAIAALDAAGGLKVLAIDGSGQLVGKASLPFEHPYGGIVAIPGGFVAIRGDQVIERIDTKGTRLGEVRPAGGQRIASLVARRGRVIAMLTGEDGVVARWLDTSAGLTWGASTPVLEIDPTTAVLSPDHARLAALQHRSRRAVLVDLATGAVTPLKGNRRDLMPLNWVAADRVAFAHDEFELSRVEWFDATGKRVAAIGNDFELEFLSVLSLAAADDQVVGFQGHQLVLVAPRKLRYLGYQLHAATRLRPTPAGMVAALGGSSEILDDNLQIERRVPTARTKDLFPIDATFALAIRGTATRSGPFDDALVAPRPKPSGVQIVLHEGDTAQQIVKMKVAELRLRYEPSTRLLAMNSGSAVTFARFDGKRFGDPIAVATSAKIRDLYLLDPRTANGAVALVVHGGKPRKKGDPGLVVRAIHEDELAGALPREAVALPGALEAVDRAGRVYVRTEAGTVTVHDGAHEIGRLTGMENMTVRPSPDGRHVGVFGRGRVIVANLDGSHRWSAGFPGIKDLQWTDDALVALGGGIAKLDPATGKTIAARCGWKFGLRNHASFVDPPGSTLCDRS